MAHNRGSGKRPNARDYHRVGSQNPFGLRLGQMISSIGRIIIRRLKKIKALKPSIELLTFLYKQRTGGFDIPTAPHFDSDLALKWFEARLTMSSAYLEYGTGGSTYLAAKHKVKFTAVDCDKFFLASVMMKLKSDGLLDKSRQSFRYANIGLTKAWGEPIIIGTPGESRMDAFRRYSDFPQKKNDDFAPDLILIDGRFRVACALKVLRELKNKTRWVMAIDDYIGRPEYRVIEDFAKLETLIGRMAIFVCPNKLDLDSLAKTIAIYEIDPR